MMKKSLLLAFTFLYALPVHASVQDLIDSIKNKDLAQAETLLKNGENVNAANEQGNTPLHYAVATNNADMARLLLAYGADMNAENTKGWSPLKIAQTKDVAEVTEVLMEKLNAPAADEIKAVKETAQKVAPKVEAVVEEIAAVEVAEDDAADEIDDAAEDAALLDDAMKAVEQARQEAKASEEARLAAVDVKNKAEAALTAAEEKIANLEQKNKDLEKTVAEQKKELDKAAEKLKAVTAAAAPAAKAAAPKATPAPAAKAAPAQKPAPKAAPKAAPAPKPQPPVKSKLNSAMTAGDEEIIYCMNILGQVENPNMVQAAGFYASNAGISHARYNEIAALANGFYSGAKEAELKSVNDQCAKIITPANAQKQNQIIRSLNMARGQ